MILVREPHGVTAYNTKRKQAWRNMMVAAINAGLEQQLFTLESGGNKWPGYLSDPEHKEKAHIFSFTFPGGIAARASVGDGGHGELSIHVALWPKNEERSVAARSANFYAGDAFAAGWLERTRGVWLQTSPSQFCCRAAKLSSVATCSVKPQGFLDRGPIG